MIVYNVKRTWFTMKNDAEAYRKELKLPPSATHTIRIDTREELAGLLNGLCGLGTVEVMERKTILAGNAVLPEAVLKAALVADEPPDCVPEFLVKAWRQRQAAT